MTKINPPSGIAVTLILFTTIILNLLVSANAQDGRSQVSLHPNQDANIELLPGALLLDPTGKLEIADVLNLQDEFQPSKGKFANPGTTDALIWYRLAVRNVGDKTASWVFSTGRSLLVFCEIYIVVDGAAKIILTNQTATHGQARRDFHFLAAPFQLSPGQDAVIYARYRGASWAGLLPELKTEAAIKHQNQLYLILFLVLFGGVSTFVIFASISFTYFGRGVAVYYCLAQIANFICYGHLAGITTVYLWPESPENGRLLAPFACGLFPILMMFFARSFFETASRLPRADKMFLVLSAFGLIALTGVMADLVFPALDHRIPLIALMVVILLISLMLPILSIYATLKWYREYWPVTIAFLFVAGFLLSQQMVWLGIINHVPYSNRMYGVFVVLEAFLIAFSVSLRVRSIRKDSAIAQQQLTESLRRELDQSQRTERLGRERELALQGLADQGRLLMAAAHDTRQLVASLRHFATAFKIAPEGKMDLQNAGYQIDEVAKGLDDIFMTAVESSWSGGVNDDFLALDSIDGNSIFKLLHLIHGKNAMEQGLDIRFRGGEVSFIGDRVLLLRCLGNFISNAIKYHTGGRILVTCRRHSGRIRLQVWDDGPGLNTELKDKLLSSDLTMLRGQANNDGLGSGIANVKRLIAQMQGAFNICARLKRGSLFELCIPLVSANLKNDIQVIIADENEGQANRLAQDARGIGITALVLQRPDELSLLPHDMLGTTILVVDEHFSGVGMGLDWAHKTREKYGLIIGPAMSFDRAASTRAEIAGKAPILIYKPVSADALVNALNYISHPDL